jgi:hypothetical protein
MQRSGLLKSEVSQMRTREASVAVRSTNVEQLLTRAPVSGWPLEPPDDPPEDDPPELDVPPDDEDDGVEELSEHAVESGKSGRRPKATLMAKRILQA